MQDVLLSGKADGCSVIELLPLQILTNKKSFAEQATRSKKSHSYRRLLEMQFAFSKLENSSWRSMRHTLDVQHMWGMPLLRFTLIGKWKNVIPVSIFL